MTHDTRSIAECHTIIATRKRLYTSTDYTTKRERIGHDTLDTRCRQSSLVLFSAVMEMNLVADSSYGSAMQAAQQQLFFKEASDASYRAKGNLTPEQQVRARCPDSFAVLARNALPSVTAVLVVFSS